MVQPSVSLNMMVIKRRFCPEVSVYQVLMAEALYASFYRDKMALRPWAKLYS